MFEKLKFWKKNEPFDYGKLESGEDLNFGSDKFSSDTTAGLGGTGDLGQMHGSETAGTGLSAQEPYKTEDINITGKGYERGYGEQGLKPAHLEHETYGTEAQHGQYQSYPTTSKDIEIVSAKLDGIKAAIETLNIRMNTIEDQLRRLNKKNEW